MSRGNFRLGNLVQMNESQPRKIKIENGGVTIDGLFLSIANIELRRTLPPGANGIVFEAHDLLLDRRVAVKIWLPSEHDKRDRKKQALAEASKLAQLEHKNIARIYMLGELEGMYIYSIMEYLDGITLRDFLKLDESHREQRFRIWDEIADALRYVHDKQIYHGDLHDRNIIMVGSTPKIIDFGTSIFAQDKIDALNRESRLLCELAKNIFTGDHPSLDKIIDKDMDLSVLMPKATLLALSAWRNVIRAWNQIVAIKEEASADDGLRLRHEMSNLAWELCEAPVFSIAYVAQLLSNLGLPTIGLHWFREFIFLWSKSKLFELTIPDDMTMRTLFSGIPTEDLTPYETYTEKWLKSAKVI